MTVSRISAKPRITREDKDQIFAEFGGHCAYCGCKLKRSTFCVNEGRSACRSCHIHKRCHGLEQYRDQIIRTVEMLRRYSPSFRHAEAFGIVHVVARPVVTFYFEMPSHG